MTGITRRSALWQGLVLAAALPVIGLAGRPAFATSSPSATVWKDPSCGCCENWAKHLKSAGFDVTVQSSSDVAAIASERAGRSVGDRHGMWDGPRGPQPSWLPEFNG